MVRGSLVGSALQGKGEREPGRYQGQEDQQMQRPGGGNMLLYLEKNQKPVWLEGGDGEGGTKRSEK